MATETHDADRFWAFAEPFLVLPGVSRSTMMGFPCLRIDGHFFASYDRRTGDLLIKLDAARVEQMLATGDGNAFAPVGRRSRAWAAIPPSQEPSWGRWLLEAFDFVSEPKS